MKTNFKSYAVCFTGANPAPFMPETMAEHVRDGGVLYVVEEPHANGQVFVSTHADPCGHVCTFMPMAMLQRIEEPATATGKGFLKPGAEVFYVDPMNAEMPIGKATVDAVYDDTAELDDKYLGVKTVPVERIFATKKEAETYYIGDDDCPF